MRLLALFLSILVIVVGAAFGAINPDVVRIDFQFARVQAPLGAALLLSLLVGWLLGGLVAWSSLYRRHRAAMHGHGTRAP